MKITKEQLKQVIQEEIDLLKEELDELDDIMIQQLEKSSPHMARNLNRLTKWLIGQAREMHNSGKDPGPWIKEGVRELQSLEHPLAKEAARVLILDGHGTFPVINLIHSLWKDQKEGEGTS
jgi:hypothetical protein